MGEDIIKDFLRRMLEVNPELPRDSMDRLESALRLEWGGAQVYVAKKRSPEVKMQRLAEGIAAGVPLLEAAAMAGCSRAGAYRLLRRPWRRR
jgi:hypothetical protein